LAPQNDIGLISSSFDGRGLEAGLTFNVPLWSDRLSLDAGFAYAALRGDMLMQYASTTNYYVLAPTGQEEILLGPPYAEFSQSTTDPVTGVVRPTAADIQQRQLKVGTYEDNRSTSASVLDAWFNIRARLVAHLDLIVGIRDMRYTNVAAELRPEVTTAAGGVRIIGGELVGVNTQTVTEIKRDVTYEGLYFGLGYSF